MLRKVLWVTYKYYLITGGIFGVISMVLLLMYEIGITSGMC